MKVTNGSEATRASMKKIVVTGDEIIEWRFARSTILQTPNTSLDYVNAVRCYHEPGGLVMLGRLLKATLKSDADVIYREVETLPADDPSATRRTVSYFPSASPYWHLYDRCAQVPRKLNDPHAVWRVLDVLGTDQPTFDNGCRPAPPDQAAADVVVVEDVRGAFASDEGRWPDCLRRPADNAWLVLRWIPPSDFSPKSPSKLPTLFREGFPDRKILAVTADELRLIGMRISKALSWERTAEDLVREIRARWSEDFRGCAHLVVSFLTDGAMVFSSTRDGLRARLYFDPNFAEGEWALNRPGRMFGSTRCLTAAIVASMLSSEDPGLLPDGTILCGVAAARLLHEQGFLADANPSDVPNVESSYPNNLKFPVDEIANFIRQRIVDPKVQKLNRDLAGVRGVAVSVEAGIRPWRLMNTELSDSAKIIKAATHIVEFGDGTYPWPFPIARFGDFVAIDRIEIESMRAVRELMKNYIASTVNQAPISIAVFGSPGNGKSFAITEIARELSATGMTSCVYNLSQFESPDAIHNALHQVQNITLSGTLPLVFWDEFDAYYEDTRLGWLRFFLKPMQEGKFSQGQATHNIGKAIFIFAGGTASRKAEFDEHIRSPHGQLAKVPDFLSRLHGYIDIADLNYSEQNLDAAVALRRAVRLRWQLLQSAGSLTRKSIWDPTASEVSEQSTVDPEAHRTSEGTKQEVHEQLSVDPGVLRAFLLIPEYKHGARSMEAIIKMSALSGKYTYDRSSLPPSEQLQLHVDAERFLALLHSD